MRHLRQSRRYLRSTRAPWNLSRVAGLTSAPSLGSRCGRTNNRAHEQGGQAEDEAIDGREIGRPLPGAITDEQLVLE